MLLIVVVYRGHYEIAKLLIAHCADINVINFYDDNLLHQAVISENMTLVKYFVKYAKFVISGIKSNLLFHTVIDTMIQIITNKIELLWSICCMINVKSQLLNYY
jgi:ankyrin repeat protein